MGSGGGAQRKLSAGAPPAGGGEDGGGVCVSPPDLLQPQHPHPGTGDVAPPAAARAGRVGMRDAGCGVGGAAAALSPPGWGGGGGWGVSGLAPPVAPGGGGDRVSILPGSAPRTPARPCNPPSSALCRASGAPPAAPPLRHHPAGPPRFASPCCASVSHGDTLAGDARGAGNPRVGLGCFGVQALLSGPHEAGFPRTRALFWILGWYGKSSARSAVQGSPVGAGSLAVSLRHPPAPQRSWACFCEEEGFEGTGMSLQQSGPPRDLQ